jgi:hypothetical protein
LGRTKTDLLTKIAIERATIKKVQNAAPMIFQGKFQGTEQTFLIDSGGTTMIIGRKIVLSLPVLAVCILRAIVPIYSQVGSKVTMGRFTQ